MSFVNNANYDFQDFYDDYGTPDEVYIAVQTSTGDFIYDSTSDTYTINGVANAPLPSADTRFTVDMTSSQTHTTTTTGGTTSFGRDGVNGRYATMKIYNIKYYNGATLVAHFDMSTGTFTDQTVNGNTLTAVGGNWDIPPTTAIVTNGLLGYWNSKQGVNGAAWNNIAPGTIGTYNAAITGAAINTYNGSTGMYFNGSTSTHVEIPVPTQLQSVTSATLEFRLNMDSTTASLNGDVLSGSSYLWYTLSQGIYFAGLFDNSRADYQYGVANSYTDNTDNYITITVDSVTKTITLYVNGVQKGAYAPTTVGTMSDLTTLRLGNPDSDLDPPTMILDNVRMYNRVLTQAEISQNYGVKTEIGLTVSGQSYTKSLNDSINGSDSLSKKSSAFKTINDTLSFSDSISKGFSKFKSLSDSLSSSDSIAKRFTGYKAFNDSLTQSDSANKQFSRYKTLSDSLSSSDSITKQFGRYKTLSDSLSSSDSIAKQFSRYRSLSDTVMSTDSLSNKGKTVLLTDAILTTESIKKIIQRFHSDSVNTSDNLKNNINVKLYDVVVTSDTTKFRSHEIIGVIELEGEQQLYVYLLGEQTTFLEFDAYLKGGNRLAANHQDFSLYPGESRTLKTTVYGDNVNLTGSTLVTTFSNEYGTATFSKSTENGGIQIVDSTHFQVMLVKTDTEQLEIGVYPYKTKLTDTNGNNTVLTVGEMTLLK